MLGQFKTFQLRRLTCILLSLATVLRGTAQEPAKKTPKYTWRAVQMLEPARRVQVRTANGKVSCALVSVDADSLTCEHGTQVTLNRAEVRSVSTSHRLRPSRFDLIVLGLATAAGSGFWVASTANYNNFEPKSQQTSLSSAAYTGAAAGAGTATLVYLLTRKTTVYKAP